jgi:acyl carrier protein
VTQEVLSQIRSILAAVLKVDISEITQDFSSDNFERWDSLAHMNVIAALEGEFEIRFDDDIIDQLSSINMIKTQVEKLLVD